MGKKWADMSNGEKAQQTFNDIKARQEKRERERLEGIKQADNFMFNNMAKAKKKKDGIRAKCYR